MTSQEDALIGLFITADDTCKENNWNFSHDSGPACGLHLSEVWTIYSFFQLSGFKHFKGFYNRALAEVGVVQLETNSSRLRRKAFFYEKAA